MPSLINESEVRRLAQEVVDIHTRARVEASQGFADLRESDRNLTNAKIATRILGDLSFLRSKAGQIVAGDASAESR
jgi:hypothetical protein